MRYYVEGNNVFFPKHGFVFHLSFGEAYRNYSTINARRKLKKGWYTRSQQNDIIHYLKEQKYITS